MNYPESMSGQSRNIPRPYEICKLLKSFSLEGSQVAARRIRGEMEVSSAGQKISAIPPESCPHLHYDEVSALLHIGDPQSMYLAINCMRSRLVITGNQAVRSLSSRLQHLGLPGTRIGNHTGPSLSNVIIALFCICIGFFICLFYFYFNFLIRSSLLIMSPGRIRNKINDIWKVRGIRPRKQNSFWHPHFGYPLDALVSQPESSGHPLKAILSLTDYDDISLALRASPLDSCP